MPDPGTVLLYILNTLAQTCAALAAFVGAVGLYKLQSLRGEHARNEHTIRGALGGSVLTLVQAQVLPLEEIIRDARGAQGPGTITPEPVKVRLRDALAEWDEFPNRQQRATTALIIFEAWNLLVIVASLVGFNCIREWAGAPWLSWALWFVAVVTAVITVGSVWVWTRGVET